MLAGIVRRPPKRALRILVLSGSRGAGFFAERLPDVFQRLVSAGVGVDVWQQAVDPTELRTRYASIGITATIMDFVEDVAAAYEWADVAIARGGANTIAELAAASLPALLIPLADASANHQAANGDLWSRAGAGMTMLERDWNPVAIASWLQVMAI